ncbi:MAG: non-homologous end-joining DNA ligase [Peptococcaceae bacterium]|nr:non-homologous end-joining DNA ligase [Peptococcaceae bacterium]
MLAVKSAPFDSEEYLFEIKWDGYRALAYLDTGATELRSRNQLDITGRFPELGKMHLSVKQLPALLDGEVVVFKGGKPSFSTLQARGRLTDPLKIKRASVNTPALYLPFDMLYASGRPILGESLARRKEILAGAVNPPLVVADFVTGSGNLFARAARDQGLEGIMAKALNSPYLPGKRSSYWKKIRFTEEADLVICGYRAGKGGRRLGALLLCGCKSGKMIFLGKVGTGFNRETEDELIGRLLALHTESPAVAVPREEARHVIWVRPELVCTVEYSEKTAEGYLRHPSFKGLRFDKGVAECEAP